MPDYSQSKIYKIVSNFTDEIYIGSTTQSLGSRKAEHKKKFKYWMVNPDSTYFVTSFKLFELGEVDIVLMENFPCENKEQLHARERYYIENNLCVNKYIPGRTVKEWCEVNKEKRKEYYEENKEKLLVYHKEYRDANKETLKQKAKERLEAKKNSKK
jgi:hypothetical protein